MSKNKTPRDPWKQKAELALKAMSDQERANFMADAASKIEQTQPAKTPLWANLVKQARGGK